MVIKGLTSAKQLLKISHNFLKNVLKSSFVQSKYKIRHIQSNTMELSCHTIRIDNIHMTF